MTHQDATKEVFVRRTIPYEFDNAVEVLKTAHRIETKIGEHGYYVTWAVGSDLKAAGNFGFREPPDQITVHSDWDHTPTTFYGGMARQLRGHFKTSETLLAGDVPVELQISS